MEKVGKAYGFFACNAKKEAIEAELPDIRQMARTPSELELALIEGFNNLKGDERLMALAEEAREAGNNYVLEATYSDATNRKTADEVAGILNQAYQSPLYEKNEQFSGGIVFEENGKYVFRD